MADIHIDDFYKDVGFILLSLYRSFPRKATVYVDDISGPDQPDEFGVHSERFLACFGTMVWLHEQDYINFESTVRQEAIDQATLSHKSFLLLSSRCQYGDGDQHHPVQPDLPISVQENTLTNANQLRAVLRTRSSLEIRRYVHYLLSTSMVYE